MEKTLRLLFLCTLIMLGNHLYATPSLHFTQSEPGNKGKGLPDTVIVTYPKNDLPQAWASVQQESRFIQIKSFRNIKLAQTQEGKLMFQNEKLTVHEVFPNPANVSTMIKYSAKVENAKISLKNVLGKDIKEFRLSATGGNKSELVIPTNYLRNGVYFYTLIVAGKAMASKKLVIKH